MRVARVGKVAVWRDETLALSQPSTASFPLDPSLAPDTAQGWDPTQPRRATRTSTVSTLRSVVHSPRCRSSLNALSSLPEKARRTDLPYRTFFALNLQALIETVIRKRIYEATYWKEHCFALSGPSLAASSPCSRLSSELINLARCPPPFSPAFAADTLIDKAVAMNTIGGVYANQRPTEFLCLTLKLLQLQPEKEILMEYLTAEEFKCVPSLPFTQKQQISLGPDCASVDFCAVSGNRYLRALAAFYIRLTFRAVEVYEILEPLLQDYRKIRYRDECAYPFHRLEHVLR